MPGPMICLAGNASVPVGRSRVQSADEGVSTNNRGVSLLYVSRSGMQQPHVKLSVATDVFVFARPFEIVMSSFGSTSTSYSGQPGDAVATTLVLQPDVFLRESSAIRRFPVSRHIIMSYFQCEKSRYRCISKAHHTPYTINLDRPRSSLNFAEVLTLPSACVTRLLIQTLVVSYFQSLCCLHFSSTSYSSTCQNLILATSFRDLLLIAFILGCPIPCYILMNPSHFFYVISSIIYMLSMALIALSPSQDAKILFGIVTTRRDVRLVLSSSILLFVRFSLLVLVLILFHLDTSLQQLCRYLVFSFHASSCSSRGCRS